MTSVLVVDDQDLVRAGLVALLNAAPGVEVAGEARDGLEAVHEAARLRPEVILMDIRLPGLDGVSATARILAGSENPRVLILTVFDLDEYVYRALRAGAAGFLLKDSPPETLISGIQAVARGDLLFGPTVTRRLVEAYTSAPPAEPAPELSGLTEREREVLRLVGTGMPNGEIATRLLVSEATVKTHLNRLMPKLGISSRAQAVVVAYETGLVRPGR
ncbi:response regulator transcription factor [Amycolatopsis rubida]|uniref:Response regulator transcription factor n=1 Tax=Amycolatopsis rubida TaxID=112413 RepID=A0ABX0C563_9PSEU|nr:response regulator transcription factor [Amycolatopsis sp. M39]MYW95173.1 response regulator [Amycolatopsis rubida]NEC60161.1 response regulator transcription factor [Amycolatopsis rubida]OAP28432.1 Transcriptional regulatory protein DegU [Amycolatopsis sp. M39]